MRRCVVLVLAVLCAITGLAQEKLLSKRIIYQVPIMQGRIVSSIAKDSVAYDYLVDKRFWWQTIDELVSAAQSRKPVFSTAKGEPIVFDSILTNLANALGKGANKVSKQEAMRAIEQEVRAIRFEEEWYYDSETMLIRKKVLAFCPVIVRDTVAMVGEDLGLAESFHYEIGWVRPKGEVLSSDTLLLARNIEFSIPIYNPAPYRWWDSHLEAEYSIPFVEGLISKAESGQIKVWQEPSSSTELSKPEILRRKQFDVLETLVLTGQEGQTTEQDTVIKASFTADNMEVFRFGEQWCFDKTSFNFVKHTNYFAPVVKIFGKEGDFRGLYPLYYIRTR